MKVTKWRPPHGSLLRRFWGLAPEITFLNHGSFGACPKPILKLQLQLRQEMERSPVQFLWRRYEEMLEPSRLTVAKFIGARPQDLVFTSNATSGVNAVVQSLKLRANDALLTTNHAYNACHNVLVQAAHASKATLQVARIPFPINRPEQVLEAIFDAVTSRTRLVMIDHVSSHTALVFPIQKIVGALEAKGIDTLVDGAHAPGMVPLDMAKLRPAYYTGNLHKWVCAPKGAGFLWVREDKQGLIHPPATSHGYNTSRPGYSRFQDRFDWTGTFDPTAWFCAGAAIGWMGKLLPGGWPAIRKRNHSLIVQARRLLCRNLDISAPCPETMLGAMCTLSLPEKFQGIPKNDKIDVEQLQLYDQFGIEVPLFRLGDPERRWFRATAQVYNSGAQYDYLARALKVCRPSP